MLYERILSTAHILLWSALNLLFNACWYLTMHQQAPLWARLCAGFAAGFWVRPIEAASARRHARRRAGSR